MSKFFIKYIDKNTDLPKKELVSAVHLLAINGSKILGIRNERGWNIPGGHVEQGETLEEALVREVQEEAGASFSDAKPLAIIESDNQDKYKGKVMLVYATKNFELGKFTPSEDAFEREIIETKEFLERHKDVIDFAELILRAKSLI